MSRTQESLRVGLRTVQRQAEALVAAVPDPEHYSPARVATTARSVAAWTWERRDGFTGGLSGCRRGQFKHGVVDAARKHGGKPMPDGTPR